MKKDPDFLLISKSTATSHFEMYFSPCMFAEARTACTNTAMLQQLRHERRDYFLLQFQNYQVVNNAS